MRRRITLREALGAWGGKFGADKARDKRPTSSELYELLIQAPWTQQRGDPVKQVTTSRSCIRELLDMLQSIQEAKVWDLALPKAARSETQWPKKIPTEGGKYTIVVRRKSEDEPSGVVTVQVEAEHRDTLEGQTVILKDGRDHILLKGKIVNGEVSGEVEELEKIIPRFLVEPES